MKHDISDWLNVLYCLQVKWWHIYSGIMRRQRDKLCLWIVRTGQVSEPRCVREHTGIYTHTRLLSMSCWTGLVTPIVAVLDSRWGGISGRRGEERRGKVSNSLSFLKHAASLLSSLPTQGCACLCFMAPLAACTWDRRGFSLYRHQCWQQHWTAL